MIVCNRRYELEKSTVFVDCPLIWLNSLKFVQRNFFFYLKCYVTARWTAWGGHAARSLTTSCHPVCPDRSDVVVG